jgi:hypothetical protein
MLISPNTILHRLSCGGQWGYIFELLLVLNRVPDAILWSTPVFGLTSNYVKSRRWLQQDSSSKLLKLITTHRTKATDCTKASNTGSKVRTQTEDAKMNAQRSYLHIGVVVDSCD